MAIHIPSGAMTTVPEYNIVLKNKLKNVGYESLNFTNTSNDCYNKTISITFSGDAPNFVIDVVGVDKYLITQDEGNCYLAIADMFSLDDKISHFKLYDPSQIVVTSTRVVQGSELTAQYHTVESIEKIDMDYNEYLSEDNESEYKFDDFYTNKFRVFMANKTQNKMAFSCMFVIAFSYNGVYATTKNLTIKIKEPVYSKTMVYNQKKDYNLQTSEFLQENTTINSVPLPKYLSDNIVDKWSGGRQTISLTCVYGKYYEYGTTNVVLNGIDGKMIEVGDVVVPTRLYTDSVTNINSEIPISQDKNGVAKEFEVVSSEIEFDNGKLVTHLKLMEVR